MTEIDNTEHNLSQHSFAIKVHSRNWYKFWGNKCPVCQAPSNVEEIKGGVDGQSSSNTNC